MSSSSDNSGIVNQLPISVVFPNDQEKFISVLTLLYKRIANAVNLKDGSLYTLNEFYDFQQWFTAGNPQLFRNNYRKVINFGTLPNAGAKTVAHSIAPIDSYAFTRIYATATDPVGHNYIPIPYASTTDANNIELSVDGTNVTITTGIDRTAFTICYVILEYCKTS